MGMVSFQQKQNGMYVINSLVYPEMINNHELMIASSGRVDGLLIIRAGNFYGRPSIECRVNGLVQLSQYLKGTVSKRKFLDIIYKAVQIMKNCKRNRLSLNNLYFNRDFMFIEPNSGRLFCIYFPIISIQNTAVPYVFLKQIAFNVLFDGNEDRTYVYEYINFFKNPNGFSLEEFEAFIIRLSGNNSRNNNGFARPINLQNPLNLKNPQNLQSLQVSQSSPVQKTQNTVSQELYTKPVHQKPDSSEKEAPSATINKGLEKDASDLVSEQHSKAVTLSKDNLNLTDIQKTDVIIPPDITEAVTPDESQNEKTELSAASEINENKQNDFEPEKAPSDITYNNNTASPSEDNADKTALKTETENIEADNLTSDEIKICSNCGAENDNSAVFCFECGNRFGLSGSSVNSESDNSASASSDKIKICGNCGAENDNSAVFCFECGNRFGLSENSVNSDSNNAVSASSDKIKICGNCGAENDNSAVFCFECGNRLGLSENPVNPDGNNAVSASSDEIKICGNCGAENDNSAVFCFECGKNLNNNSEISKQQDKTPILEEQLNSSQNNNVLNPNTPTLYSDDNTPEKYDKTTALSRDVMINQNVKYPYLIRVSNGEKIIINKACFKIGREKSSCDYVIADNRAVSRIHAEIITRNNRCYIIDLDSVNKTYVNDVIIPPQKETELSSFNSQLKIRLANEEFRFFAQ